MGRLSQSVAVLAVVFLLALCTRRRPQRHSWEAFGGRISRGHHCRRERDRFGPFALSAFRGQMDAIA